MRPVGPSEIERVFRSESGRAVASLVQDAFVQALEKWPASGLPPSPAGWIITTAKHRGLDRVRRESSRNDRQTEATRLRDRDEPQEVGAVADDQLRLVFTCCHPALLDPLELDGYHLWHAARAELLLRSGRGDEAVAAFDRALALTANEAERTLLRRLRDQALSRSAGSS